MLHHLSIDLETFSDVDLKKCGLYKYVQSPAFQIMLFAYSWDGGPVQIIDLMTDDRLPDALVQALADTGVIKHSYNASFEWYCLNKNYYTPITSWKCVMAHGLYCGYPMGLGNIGEAMGLPKDMKKLGTGSALIRTFCVPCTPTRTNGNRTRTLPHHEPEKWELLKTYCKQDVMAEMDVERRLSPFPMPESEQRLWELDQLMNTYGAAVDREMVEGALYCSEIVNAELMAEGVRISGLDNPNSTKQLKAWLEEELEEDLPNLNKDTVTGLLKKTDDDSTVRRLLQIRQELAKTSVKKYYAISTAVCSDGRVRGLIQFYGANRTGRDAGRLVQIQNLPKNYMESLQFARQLVKEKKLDMVKLMYGNVPDTLSQLIRTAFVPSPGNRLLIADFAAIEARIIAWLADEQWAIDAFATHGKIYEATASQMFGVPMDLITKGNPEYAFRQKGKVAVLSLGYQGGVAALIKQHALEQGLTEEELPEIVQRWRKANKRIVDLWYRNERAARECLSMGLPQCLKHDIRYDLESHGATGQSFLTITLPSGRKLYYSQPRLEEGPYGPRMTYMGLDQDTKKWGRLDTYGGKLTENIVQAIARDCLMHCFELIVAMGYAVIFRVHDEYVIDAPAGLDLQPVLDVMAKPIPWAPGLLLKGAGDVLEYYQKS